MRMSKSNRVTAEGIIAAVKAEADPARAALLQRYFRTGPGEYAEGDIFLGLTVPQVRALIQKFKDAPLAPLSKAMASKYHEVRLLALLILVRKYEHGTEEEKRSIYDLYLRNRKFINNWDLVDLSAGKIVGKHLMDRSKRPLFSLAKSRSLWDRRIALLASSYFVGKQEFETTLSLVEMLLRDREDLIHKAAGWMLREIYKRSPRTAEEFLVRHYVRMPRTMLRYAIEKMSAERRAAYLRGLV